MPGPDTIETVTLEKCLDIKRIGDDVFESVHRPIWTWSWSNVVPGGTLMSLAARAAYETVSPDFCIDTLQAHFVNGPKPDTPLIIRVQRLSDSGRFAYRVVTLQQNDITQVHVTTSFVRASAMKGPSMTHRVDRKSSQTIDAITLDDLEPGKSKQGPVMKYQRLPLIYGGPGAASAYPTPDSWNYTSVASIACPISSSEPRFQALGIIALSDYHVLDAPPTVHGIPFGQPDINDFDRRPNQQHFDKYTSLNHTIRFHVHKGFRADDLCYMEVNNPWTNQRRAEVQSRIFDKQGHLIATCVQGSYYVLKGDEERSKL